MLAEQRRNQILAKINTTGVVHTKDLAQEFDISTETIRKDLEAMDRDGLLSRVHGGAVALSGTGPTYAPAPAVYRPFEEREVLYHEEKIAIAKAAAELIGEGQSIALDSGTTSYELAKILLDRFTRLTIVTNSVKNALLLVGKPSFTVILTGGVLQSDEYSLVSELSGLVMEVLNPEIMFLTTCGVSAELGVTDQRMDEVQTHNKMREASQKTVVLADHSKFGQRSLIHVCDLDEVDVLITDGKVDRKIAAEIEPEVGRLIIAEDTGA